MWQGCHPLWHKRPSSPAITLTATALCTLLFLPILLCGAWSQWAADEWVHYCFYAVADTMGALSAAAEVLFVFPDSVMSTSGLC
jgi:hypothetical protein